MARRSSIVLTALITTIFLGGCAVDEATTSVERTESPAETALVSEHHATPMPSTHEETTPELNERNLVPKEIGEEAGLIDNVTDDLLVSFSITEVRYDYPCVPWSSPPELDRFVGLHFEVNVPAVDFAEDGLVPGYSFFLPDFQAFTSDGSQVDDPIGNGLMCSDEADELPSFIEAGESDSGWIVLDLPLDATSVAYVSPPHGWEWQLP